MGLHYAVATWDPWCFLSDRIFLMSRWALIPCAEAQNKDPGSQLNLTVRPRSSGLSRRLRRYQPARAVLARARNLGRRDWFQAAEN